MPKWIYFSRLKMYILITPQLLLLLHGQTAPQVHIVAPTASPCIIFKYLSILKKPSISFSMLCSTRQICKRAPFYNTLFLPALTTWVASFKGRLAGLPNLWEFKSFGWSSLKSVNIYLWFLMKYIRNQVHQKAVYVTKRDTEINSIDFMVSYI